MSRRLIGTVVDHEGALSLQTQPNCWFPLGGNSYLAHQFEMAFGPAQRGDIGKQVFRTYGVMQMENDEQRNARQAKDHITTQEPCGYIVCLETRHFHFEAHGLTEEQANEAMGRALAEHGRQYDLPSDWADDYLGDFQTSLFQPGFAFRDGERITA